MEDKQKMEKVTKQIQYEEDEDILDFWRGRPSYISFDVGDFIVDFDKQGYVVGLEVLNASENLALGKEMLKKIKDVSMSVTYKPNYVCLMLHMQFDKDAKDISIPLAIEGHKNTGKEQFVLSK